MGFPKPWLSINGEATFLEHLVKVYSDHGVDKIAVVLNNAFYSDPWMDHIRNIEKHSLVIKNDQLGKGRLHSIRIGLEKLKDTEFVFIQNIDNPYIDSKVIDALRESANPNGVSIPTFKGKGGHPVLISNKITMSLMEGYNIRDTLHNVFDEFERRYIEVENENVLININTPKEYSRMQFGVHN
ncbi:MAG: NTP transferase domain-containing protein [Cytophagales bacterium]|nr:NTP transferase domain-containing protein [Cytophagales bacterium]